MPGENEDGQGGGFGMVAGVVLLVTGLLATAFVVSAVLGVNPFIRLGPGRSKQSEAKANLKYAFTAERAYYMEQDTLTDDASQLGFQPERGNRYGYFLAPRGLVQSRDTTTLAAGRSAQVIDRDRLRYPEVVAFRNFAQTGCPVTPCGTPPDVLSVPGVIVPNAAAPEGVFLFVAAGNVDRDETHDCWSICSHPRTKDGQANPPGEPLHARAD